MGKNKTGRPSWFKLFLHHKSLVEAVPDEVAGKALKAALRYFDTGEMAELDSLAVAVFAALKPNIDEAFEAFETTSEKNRKNIQKRWSNRGIPNDTTCTTGYHSIPNDTKNTEEEGEVEVEVEEEEEGEGECNRAAKPPKPARFSPPSVDEVRAYCNERGYTTIDPERFVSYYAARQWKAGQTAITDWRAAADSWHRNDVDKRKTNGGCESGVDRLARLYKEEFGE